MGIFIDAGLKVTGVLGIAKKFVRRNSEEENPPRMICFVEFSEVDEAVLGMSLFSNKEGIKIIFSKEGVEKVKKGYEDKNMGDSLVEEDAVPPLPPLVEKKEPAKVEEEKAEETESDKKEDEEATEQTTAEEPSDVETTE